MRPLALIFPLACLAVAATAMAAAAPPSSAPVSLVRREAALHRPDDLRPVSAFVSITDQKARSVAIFQEAGKVITHPRCVNCHPADGMPRQGLDRRVHNPPMVGGEDGHGPAGIRCSSCHGVGNFAVGGVDTRSVPGNPAWALAPASMAWQGKSLGDICRQIKDPGRNGGKSLAQIHEHMAADTLVGWGWDPGEGRAPVPGTQQRFGELIKAWIDTGAVCPA